jgi:hypothetical protein
VVLGTIDGTSTDALRSRSFGRHQGGPASLPSFDTHKAVAVVWPSVVGAQTSLKVRYSLAMQLPVEPTEAQLEAFSGPAFVSSSWSLWVGGIVLLSAICIVLGLRARPLTMAMYCIPLGIVLLVSSLLPFRSSLAIISAPLTGGWLCSVFRHGHLEPLQFLGGSLAPFVGLISVCYESWIPTVLASVAVIAAARAAAHFSRGVLMAASALPTMMAILALSSPARLM